MCYFFPLKGISQPITGIADIPVLLKTEKMAYAIGDTMKLAFSFDTMEVIHSNFGGCGNGPVFMVRDINKPESGGIHPVTCYLMLQESYFSNQGKFEIVIREPGIYYIVLYVKSHDQDVSSERWSNPIRSNEFEVIKK